jgi:DNA-binding FadR family transcriptional regulator
MTELSRLSIAIPHAREAAEMTTSATTPPPRAGRFTTRSPVRLHGDIANYIGRAIVSGGYGPGDLLPGEIAFSGSEGVSRTAYREALRMLAAKGLVESRPKTGTRVCARERWNLLDPDLVRWFFEDGTPPGHILQDLFELRQIVEPAAAALAAERRSAADLAEIGDALDTMRTRTLVDPEGREGDRRFHAGILVATGNDVLISMASGVTAAVGWTTHYKFRTLPLPRDPIPEHQAVFDAIEAGDGEVAREAMRELVGHALLDTLHAMDFERPGLA